MWHTENVEIILGVVGEVLEQKLLQAIVQVNGNSLLVSGIIVIVDIREASTNWRIDPDHVGLGCPDAV